MLTIGVVFEIFGLGILVPLLKLILEPESLNDNQGIKVIYELFKFKTHSSFINFFLIIISIIYVFKTVYIVYLYHRQNRFISNFIANLSNSLFSKYLYSPYSFHVSVNSSELIKNLQVEVSNFWNLSISALTIFVESALLISVIFTLLYIEPIGAITIGSFFSFFSYLFFLFSKNKIKSWGEKRETIDRENSKILLESFGGIKDIILIGREKFFTTPFNKNNFTKARLWSKNATFSQFPRFYLEMISLIGLVLFVFVMLVQNREINDLVTTLGVFVAATFKLIPSLNRIIAASQSFKFYKPSLDILHKELNERHFTESIITREKLRIKNSLEIKNLSFTHQGSDKEIFNSVNLKIKKNQIIGFIGESGSGKSTLVDLIVGLQKPTKGSILVDGQSIFKDLRKWQNNIGYVSQNIFLLDDTIKSNVAFGVDKTMIDEDRVNIVLRFVKLDRFISSLSEGILTKVGERGIQLSGGQKQRLGIARALYHNPDILVLDEATSALDTQTEKEVMKTIYELMGAKTILIIAHRTSTLKKADLVYKITDETITSRHVKELN